MGTVHPRTKKGPLVVHQRPLTISESHNGPAVTCTQIHTDSRSPWQETPLLPLIPFPLPPVGRPLPRQTLLNGLKRFLE